MPYSSVKEGYPPHLLAQRLNNRAVEQIEDGRYEEAIQTLVKGLKFSELSTADDDVNNDDDDDGSGGAGESGNGASAVRPCQCTHCSLASCIMTSLSGYIHPTNGPAGRRGSRGQVRKSSTNPPEALIDDGTTSTLPSWKQQQEQLQQQQQEQPQPEAAASTTKPCGGDYVTQGHDPLDDQEHYLFRKPIRVSSVSISNGHTMGCTLSLIIILNLALAHHLYGTGSGGKPSPSLLKKALQLYELSYQLHLDNEQQEQEQEQQEEEQHQQQPHRCETDQDRVGLLLFTMIISNNLGEIHRVVRNDRKHRLCLQHLLSTIMYMVDGRYLLTDHPTRRRRHPRRRHHPTPVLLEEELDGFIRNTYAIMSNNVCAGAA